jgi:hypothetical protein
MKSRKVKRNRRNKTRRGGTNLTTSDSTKEPISPRHIDFDKYVDEEYDETQINLDRALLNKQKAYRKNNPEKQNYNGRNQQFIDDNDKYLQKILSFTGVSKKDFNRFIEESDINKLDKYGEQIVDIVDTIRKFFQEKINNQMALREQTLLKRVSKSISEEKTKRLLQLESLLDSDDFDGVLAGIRTDRTGLFGAIQPSRV